MKSNTADPYERALEHVRKMADTHRGAFLRGVIDAIHEHGGAESREALRQLFSPAAQVLREDRCRPRA